MGLEELKKEIKRLNSLKENREHCTIDSQLKTIKMVIEAIEGLCIKESEKEFYNYLITECNHVHKEAIKVIKIKRKTPIPYSMTQRND